MNPQKRQVGPALTAYHRLCESSSEHSDKTGCSADRSIEDSIRMNPIRIFSIRFRLELMSGYQRYKITALHAKLLCPMSPSVGVEQMFVTTINRGQRALEILKGE